MSGDSGILMGCTGSQNGHYSPIGWNPLALHKRSFVQWRGVYMKQCHALKELACRFGDIRSPSPDQVTKQDAVAATDVPIHSDDRHTPVNLIRHNAFCHHCSVP